MAYCKSAEGLPSARSEFAGRKMRIHASSAEAMRAALSDVFTSSLSGLSPLLRSICMLAIQINPFATVSGPEPGKSDDKLEDYDACPGDYLVDLAVTYGDLIRRINRTCTITFEKGDVYTFGASVRYLRLRNSKNSGVRIRKTEARR